MINRVHSIFILYIGKKETKCQREFVAATKDTAVDGFIPRCKLDGSYADVQCRGSVCFCVDKDGNEITGTKTPLASGKPNCTAPCMLHLFLIVSLLSFIFELSDAYSTI